MCSGEYAHPGTHQQSRLAPEAGAGNNCQIAALRDWTFPKPPWKHRASTPLFMTIIKKVQRILKSNTQNHFTERRYNEKYSRLVSEANLKICRSIKNYYTSHLQRRDIPNR